MAIILRKIFYGKVGSAGPLVEHMKEGDALLAKYGQGFKSRWLTDWMSGRSDRVVVECEMENLADMDAALNTAMSSPEGQAEFSRWMEKLSSLIHYSEAEIWTIQ